MNEDVWKEYGDQDCSWFDVSNRDLALGLIDERDLEAQLLAIKGLLSRNQQDDEAIAVEIKQLDEEIRANAHRTEMYRMRLEDEWLESLHHSVFQDAAHSMAAVGMLAPFVESLFASIFKGVHKWQQCNNSALGGDTNIVESSSESRDAHSEFQYQRRRCGVVASILNVARTTGLSEYLPSGYDKALRALFVYRNKMFHGGFEWPVKDRNEFDKLRYREWPSEWFWTATRDDKPWIFYMSEDFILHWLNTIDEVLDGVGAYMKKQID